MFAAGTEFGCPTTNGSGAPGEEMAMIQIWDLRAPASPVAVWAESCADDVTVLSFQSQTQTQTQSQSQRAGMLSLLLLSGCMDGLMTVFDAGVVDEDDAVVRVVNHGAAVRRAGFLKDGAGVWALSADERFSLYALGHDERDEDGDGGEVCAFGNVRPLLGCDYVVDILDADTGDGDDGGLVICTGSFRYVCFD